MSNQLDLLFDIAKEAAKEVTKEIAKEAIKEAHYDQNAAFLLAKNIYFTNMKRNPTLEESNDLYEVISDLCDEEVKRKKKHKIQQYMHLIQNMWTKKP